ncbi:MAG: pyridoxamine 5'-phosphate oxidase family protein [Nitrospinota bacterium]|nr:pyridoxamine 5'-phosphate oxidase family protein [Nitrospinota bacterium]
MTEKTIDSLQELRDSFGFPSGRAAEKEMSCLDKHARAFIELSPFLIIATATETGADASPKGDPPGFVKVLGDNQIFIPDRPGNSRVDTMRNLLINPQIGVIFLVPGMSETLRVNGRAKITTDDDLLSSSSVKGKTPKCGILVEIDEVYMHCAKSIIRSKLWDSESQIDRKTFPSLGKIFTDQIGGGLNAKEVDEDIENKYKERLY